MEKSENQRIRLTKRLVHEALVALLQEKSLEQITVRELCQKAGINRTTFYNHYGSQQDVLNEISDQFLGEIAHQLENARCGHPDEMREKLTMMLQYLLDHRSTALLMLNNRLDTSFSMRLVSLPRIELLLRESLDSVPSEAERSGITMFVMAGTYQMICQWLRRPEKLEAADLAALILKLCRRVTGAEGI